MGILQWNTQPEKEIAFITYGKLSSEILYELKWYYRKRSGPKNPWLAKMATQIQKKKMSEQRSFVNKTVVSNKNINLEHLQPSRAKILDDGWYRDRTMNRNHNVRGRKTVKEKVHLYGIVIYCKTCAQVCLRRSYATQTSDVPTISFWHTDLMMQVWSMTIVYMCRS